MLLSSPVALNDESRTVDSRGKSNDTAGSPDHHQSYQHHHSRGSETRKCFSAVTRKYFAYFVALRHGEHWIFFAIKIYKVRMHLSLGLKFKIKFLIIIQSRRQRNCSRAIITQSTVMYKFFKIFKFHNKNFPPTFFSNPSKFIK